MKQMYSVLLPLILTAGIFATGCSEDTIDPVEVKPKVIFFHAAPDTAVQGVHLLVEGESVALNHSFGNVTTYLDVASGTRNVKLVSSGTTNTIFEGIHRFEESESYTLIAVNDGAGNADLLLFRDDLTTPASGTALIRAAHLIFDAPKTRVALKESGLGPLYDSLEFKQNSESFVQAVPPNPYQVVRFMDAQLTGPGDTTGTGIDPILEEQVTLEDGKIYTLAATGTTAAPSLTVIKHN